MRVVDWYRSSERSCGHRREENLHISSISRSAISVFEMPQSLSPDVL